MWSVESRDCGVPVPGPGPIVTSACVVVLLTWLAHEGTELPTGDSGQSKGAGDE